MLGYNNKKIIEGHRKAKRRSAYMATRFSKTEARIIRKEGKKS
jgi:hypothetical protein